jgi:general secretion pathway protein G
MSSKRKAGFTLVEVLIVVVILAVLAATIIPQFSSSTTDAKVSALQFNLNSIRSQIELYKAYHNGSVPALTSGALPQLTSATDANGNVGTQGPSFPYGPYIQTFPVEPFSGIATVTATATFPPTAATSAGGWFYNTTTGQIAANNGSYLTY